MRAWHASGWEYDHRGGWQNPALGREPAQGPEHESEMKRPQPHIPASAEDRAGTARTVRLGDEQELRTRGIDAADREATRALPGHGDATQPLPGVPGGPRVVLDRYRLERRLGSGGFGVVWLAWDTRLEREVAVKAIPREGGDERVEREARAAARLNHPGIVALYELASDDHDTYLVSELVRGRTLSELMRAGAVADRDVARIGAALCDALEHAHSQGVIHRDVKPQNIMVVAEPAVGAGFAKLADFGVAHVASGDPLTHTGDVVGTLAYMAPEQAEGAPVTPASDVYSLALSLYEAWTGSNPMRAASPAATARRLGTPPASLGHRRRDLPIELCDALDDALEPDPRIRPTPTELRQALRDAEPELTDAGGLVEPETLARVGLTTGRRRRKPFGRRAADGDDEPAPRIPLPRLLISRGFAGAAAGILTLVLLTQLGPTPPVSPLGAAVAAGVAVALLPRLGWIATALALVGWLASPEADRAGTALIVATGAAVVPILLPRAGTFWSLPALAPLLGGIALGPAYVAVAGLAPARPRGRVGTALATDDAAAARRQPFAGSLRRAALGAAGFVWLALAETLTGDDLLFGVADGTLPRVEWQGSVTSAATDALQPLLTSGALAPAVVWAAFAALLPLAVRGRSLALDAAAAAAWAVGLIVAHAALGDLLAGASALEEARGAVAGPLVGAVIAVAVAAWRRSGEELRAEAVAPAWDYPANAR
jgi:eukaryotic-like serine/threonine-protein kinase